MYTERLRELLIELEDIDNHIQESCIDQSLLNSVRNESDPEEIRLKTSELTSLANHAIEDLIDYLNGEEK